MNRQKSFLLLFIGIILTLCLLMVLPFLGYLLTGLILAFILHPLKSWISQYTRGSSAIVVVLTVVMAVLPIIFTLGIVADDASNVVNSIGNQNWSLGYVEEQVYELTGQEVSIEERLKSSLETIGTTVLSSTSQIVDLASGFLIGLSLLLFTQFYGLKQGEQLVNWTKKFDVIPDDIQEELYRKTAGTTRTVIKGHVLTAVASGLVAGLGLFIAGVSNVAFWTFMMMILGLIPLIGTALVWAPAAIYLLINGQIYSGLLLLVYGIVIVGATDNFLRPFLVDESADIHPLLIILGVIGGISVFGPIGIFVGPVMFGIAKSLLNIYLENYDSL